VVRLCKQCFSTIVVLLGSPLAVASGQPAHDHDARRWSLGAAAQAIPILTRATPTASRRHLTETDLTQPVLSGHVSTLHGRLVGHAMLNLEGLTLTRGELNTGTYGEGYVDRRHPHSYVHELLVTARTDLSLRAQPAALSLTAGRGFAPFGSDDPMARPFVKYPVNHHLTQVLERLVLIAAARAGPLTVEGGLFNGDEPLSPGSVPNWSRFGDSWSVRATALPAAGVEIAASIARVESPEFRDGLGLDQRKASTVLRIERSQPRSEQSRYLLAEWARTHEYRRGQHVFTFTSFLAEGAYSQRGRWAAVRFERTTRPEEERLIDSFRTPRPQMEFAILGRTRWTAVTIAAGTNAPQAGVLTVAPFVEATYAHATEVEALAAFVPRDFYGSDRLWLLALGARVNVGPPLHRMGRYGAALSSSPTH
jgi:hypothetical protein